MSDLDCRQRRVPAGGVVRAALPPVVDGDQPGSLRDPVSHEVAVPQEKLWVDLPQESPRLLDPPFPIFFGNFPDAQGGDGVNRGLTEAAGVGRGIGGSCGTRPVVRAWEVALWRGLWIENDMGNLAGPPLVLEEGEEFPRDTTGAQVGEPDSNERAVPAPLVRVEVGGGAGPISHVVVAPTLRVAGAGTIVGMVCRVPSNFSPERSRTFPTDTWQS